MNRSAWTVGCFNQQNVHPQFAQRVGAHQARNSSANNQRWDVTSHGVAKYLAISESFREQGLGSELLPFQVGIEDHGQVANEDPPKPGGANFAALQQD